MRGRAPIPLLPILALAALVVFVTTTAHASGQAEIIWNETDTYVKVQPLTSPLALKGFVFNAFYNGSNSDGTFNVVLVAYNYSASPYTSATFELWDYWTHDLIGNITVSGKTQVTVPGNITILYVYVGKYKFGPYYISTVPKLVEWPEEVRGLVPFVLVAIMVAFALRGSARDVAIGLVLFGIFAPYLAAIFGLPGTYGQLFRYLSLALAAVLILLIEKERQP